MLAQRVAELIERGQVSPGEVVVLLRSSGDLEVFERALQLRGLRTLASVGAFWGHQQVGDLIAYLRVLANPLDEEALYGALASPLGGCSRDCLALLADAARSSRRGAWETALEAVAGGDHDLHARLDPHRMHPVIAVRNFHAKLQHVHPFHQDLEMLTPRVVVSAARRRCEPSPS